MSATSTPFSPTQPSDTDDLVGHARSHQLVPADSILRHVVRTSARLSPAIARLTLGLVMLPHALQKTAGWFGGHGLEKTYASFTGKMGLPGPIAFLVIAAELLGAAALVLGLLTRVGAVAIMAIMVGAIGVVHLPHGFFMNWSGAKAGEGIEFHLLAIALALVCLFEGGGRASLDRMLMKWRPAPGGSISPALSEG